MSRVVFLMAAVLAGSHALADAREPDSHVKFAVSPKVEKIAGGGWKISFAASAATDIEAAILDSDDKIIRHLAAGMLGKAAPAPLKADSLSQQLVWDGKDGTGKAAAGGPFKARVRLGMQPELESYVGGAQLYWDNEIRGVAVSPVGEVYVMAVMGSGYAGTRAFIVGAKKAVAMAVKRVDSRRRVATLKERLAARG